MQLDHLEGLDTLEATRIVGRRWNVLSHCDRCHDAVVACIASERLDDVVGHLLSVQARGSMRRLPLLATKARHQTTQPRHLIRCLCAACACCIASSSVDAFDHEPSHFVFCRPLPQVHGISTRELQGKIHTFTSIKRLGITNMSQSSMSALSGLKRCYPQFMSWARRCPLCVIIPALSWASERKVTAEAFRYYAGTVKHGCRVLGTVRGELRSPQPLRHDASRLRQLLCR